MTNPEGVRSAAVFAVVTLTAAVALIPPANAQDLRTGVVVADSLSAEDEHEYTLTVPADRYIYGYVDQITVDVVVRLVDGEGTTIAEFDSPARGPESFQFVTKKADTYKITVSPFERAEGRYEILLVTNEPKATNPKKLVDQLMQPYTGKDRPGAVVSILKNGDVVLAKGYGMSNLTYSVPMTERTGMSIASVSKQFTAMAILLLQNDGKLSIEDDVRKYIPELRDFGTPVTLKNMLNHTSGYREVLNFLPMSGWNATDALTREQLIRIIQRQPRLQNEPGTEYNYNNTTFMLLATVVERVSGQPFREFMEQRIFRPLGMNDTTIKTHQGQVIPNSSQGYVNAEDGGFQYVTDFASAYGASGVNSTALDMTRWMLNYRDAKVGGPAAINQLTTRGILASGDTTGYALGLGVGEWRGLRRFSHSGGETSHASMFVYFPDIASGIFLSSNHPAFNRGIWTDLAEAFFGESLQPAEEAEMATSDDSSETDDNDHAKPAPEQLAAIAGTYSFVGAPLIIEYTVEDGSLYAQATNQPRFAVTPTSDSTFTFVGVAASVTFHYEPDGSVKTATHHQGGDSPMEKIVVPDLTPEELAQYTGRYYNAELETVYTITLEDGELMAHHVRYEPFSVKHLRDEQFTGGIWFLRNIEFSRNPAGTVAGFSAGNGRTRGVWFDRMD